MIQTMHTQRTCSLLARPQKWTDALWKSRMWSWTITLYTVKFLWFRNKYLLRKKVRDIASSANLLIISWKTCKSLVFTHQRIFSFILVVFSILCHLYFDIIEFVRSVRL
jgi:hypothetical protein